MTVHGDGLAPLEEIADRALAHVLTSRLLVMRSAVLVGRARWMVAQARHRRRRCAGLATCVHQLPKRRRRRRSHLKVVR
jgi:hypothetical protein